MHFKIPTGTTTNEIEAIIEHGMDAMFYAIDNNEDPDVSFLQEESEEAKEAEKERILVANLMTMRRAQHCQQRTFSKIRTVSGVR
jgi:hypothetical protein